MVLGEVNSRGAEGKGDWREGWVVPREAGGMAST